MDESTDKFHILRFYNRKILIVVVGFRAGLAGGVRFSKVLPFRIKEAYSRSLLRTDVTNT